MTRRQTWYCGAFEEWHYQLPNQDKKILFLSAQVFWGSVIFYSPKDFIFENFRRTPKHWKRGVIAIIVRRSGQTKIRNFRSVVLV